MGLEVEPELGAGLEVGRETKRCVRRYVAPTGDDLGDPIGGYADRLGETVGAQLVGHHEVLLQVFAGVDGGKVVHCVRPQLRPSSVVIGDLNVIGVAVAPAEAHSPLVVDPDRVLPFPVMPQLFQAVPGAS